MQSRGYAVCRAIRAGSGIVTEIHTQDKEEESVLDGLAFLNCDIKFSVAPRLPPNMSAFIQQHKPQGLGRLVRLVLPRPGPGNLLSTLLLSALILKWGHDVSGNPVMNHKRTCPTHSESCRAPRHPGHVRNSLFKPLVHCEEFNELKLGHVISKPEFKLQQFATANVHERDSVASGAVGCAVPDAGPSHMGTRHGRQHQPLVRNW